MSEQVEHTSGRIGRDGGRTGRGEGRMKGNTLKTGSFCSGIAAPELAAAGLGFAPQWFSEIDAFPSAVLAERFPGVPNLGDMTKLKGHDLAPVDLIVAGTPCQSFSVAGLRKGMADPRGNLALVFLGLVDQIRPRWLVWENVPGVLSSAEGRDFGSFLGALGQLGYGWAYRVLDAQYAGVPQRRRRVFVVGCLGNWQRAAAVLFERHSLSGNPAPSREAGPGVAALTANGVGTYGADDNQAQAGHLVTGTLTVAYSKQRHNGMVEMENGLITHSLRGEGFDASEDGTGRGTPLVPVAFDTTQVTSASNYSLNAPNGGGRRQELNVAGGFGVRRMTPRECERLQGFPDDWTLITYRGKPAKDGPRYKAIGNSMAVPVMRWIQERIVQVDLLIQASA